jgi:hypothetical protein
MKKRSIHADAGFMFIAYNHRRIGNIFTRDQLKEYLRMLLSLFLTIYDFFRGKIWQYIGHLYNPSINLA